MEGISPTLAFAALLFGLSDGPHDTAHDRLAEAAIKDDCPALMVIGDPAQFAAPESWAEAFKDSATGLPVLPEIIDPTWTDAAEPRRELATAAVLRGTDPIARRAVAVGASGPEIDPCAPER